MEPEHDLARRPRETGNRLIAKPAEHSDSRTPIGRVEQRRNPRERASHRRGMARRFALVGLAVQLLAAGPSHADQSRIVQGTRTSDYPSVGMLLVGNNPNTRSMVCTGTMIGCRTFLTAAHCVCLGDNNGTDCQAGPAAPDPARYQVYFQHVGVFAVTDIVVHPDFDFPDADLAVVTLADDVTGLQPSRLPTSAAIIGSAGEIVGFGTPDGSGPSIFGIKRGGTVKTAFCDSGDDQEMVCWDFTGSGSNTCSGDSGGPLFTGGATPVVTGVTGGGDAASCLAPDHSHDVNVFTYRSWILAQTTESEEVTHCGAGPRAGEDGAPVQAIEGVLAAVADHTFEVPAATRELRIGFNGREGAFTDFSFYAGPGASPTPAAAPCSHELPVQSGVCVLADPEPGTWFFRVEAFRGTGEYQATVTTFLRGFPACGDPDGTGVATASDALRALRTAVGADACDLAFCDADGSGRISASDALRVLFVAVDREVALACPEPSVTTTTLSFGLVR